MKKIILAMFMAFAGVSIQAQVNIDQMIEAPGGGYIIFTDWGADYPLPGIQEYHAWKDLHLVDTFAIFTDSVCISLFMDSVAMNCVQIPGIEGVCLDTFYVTPGDSLVLVECDNDTTFFEGATGASFLNSVEGVENDGGNIDLIEGYGVNIAADDGANTITIEVDSSQFVTPTDDKNGMFTPSNSGSTVSAAFNAVLTDYFRFTGGVNDGLSLHNTSTSWGPTIQMTNATTGNTWLADGTLIGLGSNEEFVIWNIENTPIQLYTNNLERARITQTGTFGIGTTVPGGILDVNLGTSSAFRLTYDDANGSAATYMDHTLASDGKMTFNAVGTSTKFIFSDILQGTPYGTGAITGTPTYLAAFDASGNVIETALSGADTDDQGLTIEGAGPTYDIAIDGGTDVTIAGAGGITLSESPANTLVITQTADGDGSATNEIQTLDASGTGPTITLDLSSDASDITMVGAGNVAITASGNAITITGTGGADQTLDVSGTGPTVTLDLSGDATDPTITGSGAAAVTATGNAITVGVSQEAIQDYVGPMVDPGNTETGITVTYDDIGNMFDFVVADASATNELQTLAAGGAGPTSYTIDLTSSASYVTLAEGTGMNLTRSTNTITLNSIEDQGLGFIADAPNVDMFIDDGNTMTFIAGTNITLSNTGTTMTINASSGSSDADWLEEGLGTPPNAVNDHMYTGTGDHGFGTTTPDKQVDIANSAATGPELQMDYTTGTDVGGIMGTFSYAYANENLVTVVGQKRVSNSNNDATWTVNMKDDGGSTAPGLQVSYLTGTVVDEPRLITYGGHQNRNWVNISTNTTLDEGHYGVRVTASSVTITLPALTQTNTAGIGTELIIFNTSAGSITIDPGSNTGGNVDTLNGSTANTTLTTKESKHYICTYIDASGAQDWISID